MGLTVGRGTPTVSGGATSGWLANKPPAYTLTREINFSQSIPAGVGGGAIGTGAQRAITGATNWYAIYDADGSGGSNWSQITASDEPGSPSTAWRLHFEAGTYNDGTTHGNVFTILSGGPTGLYGCYSIRYDPAFLWHPISNKHINLSIAGGLWIIQSLEAPNMWLRVHNMVTDTLFTPTINTPITLGVWHIIEFHIAQGSPGTIKVWVDGELRTNVTNSNFTIAFQEFGLYGHRGGGGETLAADCYYDLGHIYLATP